MKPLIYLFLMTLFPLKALAGGHAEAAMVIDMTGTVYGYLGVIIFVLAYVLVPLENNIHLRKSKPVLFAAGIIWVLLAIAYIQMGDTHTAHEAIRNSLLEYAELFLFLLAAMTYINAMEERNVFQSLRAYLVSKGWSLRMIFWITGILAFFISPVADNLTTALLMGAVVMAVGGTNKKFVAIACINVVVAANAGGAFSPFGDITTLMVWQKGHVAFSQFFSIFIPSVVNWLVPAIVMSFAISRDIPKKFDEVVTMKYGAYGIIALFLITIATAVSFHNFLHLPPAAGMMLGLGFLGPFSYHIKMHEGRRERADSILGVREDEKEHPLTTLIHSTDPLSDRIEQMDLPVFVINTQHEVTHWNKACEAITGITAKEMVGTKNQWKPFYENKQPMMADLVLNYMPEKMMEQQYKGRFLKSNHIEGAFSAARFVPSLGKEGKWVSFSSAPLKGPDGMVSGAIQVLEDFSEKKRSAHHFDLMKKIARAEWDTLLFFYGVILCVGGLAQFGYLGAISQYMYHDLGATTANVIVGFLSAIVDNIPVMFAVLTMEPAMPLGQWLLVTLTAGVGGSMLSIGSAAGVALMGTARGTYTFGTHLKWTPVIILGYAASIVCHLFINSKLM